MAVSMVGVNSSKDDRAPFQNGFWPIKLLVFVGLLINAIFIPAGIFDTIWMWFGLIGGSVFIPMQLVPLVDLITSLTAGYLAEYVETKNRKRTKKRIRYTRYYHISIITIYMAVAFGAFEIIRRTMDDMGDFVHFFNSNSTFILYGLFLWNAFLLIIYYHNEESAPIPFGAFKSALLNLYVCFWTWTLSHNDSDTNVNRVGILLPFMSNNNRHCLIIYESINPFFRSHFME